ncbi:hypothetical protein TNCV_4661461 [Trichonephila clavipes]|uniref:Uncharacterized protein n=1 Tax=Trichonephila clavipes TaxID=2585209 RepID=A0A8X6SCW7_TRICX|nr:hypothetical protein TNCV_4661461 [Trichonephila clavipes]
MSSWLVCCGFEPSATEDPECGGADTHLICQAQSLLYGSLWPWLRTRGQQCGFRFLMPLKTRRVERLMLEKSTEVESLQVGMG